MSEVVGDSDNGPAVFGTSTSLSGGDSAGILGLGDPCPGVIGRSTTWIGVYGLTDGIENSPAGVMGEHKGAGIGVKAVSKDGNGLVAISDGGIGVYGTS